MRDESLAAVQLEQQIFGAAVHVDDALAGEPLRERRGKGEADVRPPQLDLVDPGAEHGGREAAPHSLDFGQFRHRAGLSSGERKPVLPAGAKILIIAPIKAAR